MDFTVLCHNSWKWQQLDIKQENCIIKQRGIKRQETVSPTPDASLFSNVGLNNDSHHESEVL